MDPLVIVAKLQKILQDNLQRVGDNMISGGVDNMEKYRYILGQINALESVRQELSSLLNSKEKNEGTVIDIGDHKPKDSTTK